MSLQEFKFVRAPFAGVITSRNFDIGAFINAGGGSGGATAGMGGTQTAGAAGNSGASGNPTSGGTSLTSPSSGSGSGSGAELFRVAQIGTVRVLVNVPQSNAPGIRPGQPATVTVQEYDGRKFEGTVTRTSSALDQTSRTLLTEVQVGNPNLLLLPGMYAQVQFGDVRSAPPLLVPGDAVIPSPSGLSVAVLADPTVEDRKHLEDQGHQVANSRRVHLKRVQVGRDYGSEIEVVAGLEGWERVIVNPGDEVREGALVTPHGSSEQVPAGIGASGHTAPTHGKEGQKGDK
jgi:multidrug efflux pump subunit AcrA (membrane-fusion protein)